MVVSFIYLRWDSIKQVVVLTVRLIDFFSSQILDQ